MSNTIWCLFSVENGYDQPDNNLVLWWSTRPSLEILVAFFAKLMDEAFDEDIVKVVAIWQGHRTALYPGGTGYRLEEVNEGSWL